MLALCCSVGRDYFWPKDIAHKVQQIDEGWEKGMLVTSVKQTKKSRQCRTKGFVQALKKGNTGQLFELDLHLPFPEM